MLSIKSDWAGLHRIINREAVRDVRPAVITVRDSCGIVMMRTEVNTKSGQT